ncbi:MAG: succinate dehydrogenase cytochrome b subunit [Verrucomicrobiota bacterium]
MKILDRLFKSSLGKKLIMAVTGVALFGFVVGHLLGNLQVFLGDEGEAINRYGHFLKSTPELLWGARIGLLVMVALHIWSAIKLSAENKAARPVEYAGSPTPVVATYASRTMLMSGLIIAAFVIYHLLHYTVLVKGVNLTGKDFHEFFTTLRDGTRCHDVYRMMVTGFKQPAVSVFYIIAMGLLCLHLSHGLAAMFSSLGWKSKAWEAVINKFARIASGAIFIGYISIPIAILLGIVK